MITSDDYFGCNIGITCSKSCSLTYCWTLLNHTYRIGITSALAGILDVSHPLKENHFSYLQLISHLFAERDWSWDCFSPNSHQFPHDSLHHGASLERFRLRDAEGTHGWQLPETSREEIPKDGIGNHQNSRESLFWSFLDSFLSNYRDVYSTYLCTYLRISSWMPVEPQNFGLDQQDILGYPSLSYDLFP